MRHENDVTFEFKCKFCKHLGSPYLATIAKFDEILKIGGCTQLLRELPARNDELKNSFVNRTIPQWNCLPAAVAEADSVVAFKSRLAALRD